MEIKFSPPDITEAEIEEVADTLWKKSWQAIAIQGVQRV